MPVRRKAVRRPLNADPLEQTIVTAAVARGRAVGWDRVRLADIARDLKLPVSEIVRAYRDLDAVADAWFARATSAMADAGTRAAGRAPKARLETAMLAWFDALASERRVTAQMLRTKLYPAHPHHWVPVIFSLSRTIQLLRDVAGLGADGTRRQIEEVGLSALFVAALGVWCRDETEGQKRTRAFIARWLAAADRALTRPADAKRSRNPG